MRSNPDQSLAEYRAAMRPRSSAKIAHHTERPFEYVPSGHAVSVLPGDGSLLAASTARRRADLVACDYGRAYLAYVLASDAGEITEAERAALNRARLNVLSVVHSRLPDSDYAPGDAESYGRPAFDQPRHSATVTTDDAGRTVTTDDAGNAIRTMPAFSDVQLAACRTCVPTLAEQAARHDAKETGIDRYGRHLTGEPDTY